MRQILSLSLFLFAPLVLARQLPVVIWHGLGDSYLNEGLKSFAEDLEKRLNVSTHLIHVAEGKDDQKATFFGKAAQQVEIAAEQIRNQPFLQDGYDAIGFSQGGQFLRALAQNYPSPPMRTLITLGSQHLGISEMAACRPGDWLCRSAEWLLRSGVWSGAAQGRLIPAQYFRNQVSIASYLINSGWLREINNERWGDKQVGGSEDYLDNAGEEHGDQSPRNATLKENLLKLKHFVLFSFSAEKTVIPYTSAQFGLLNYSTSPATPIPLQSLPIYLEDYLGLKELDERGSLHLGNTCKGAHMQIDEECWDEVIGWLIYCAKDAAEIVEPFVVQM